MNKEEILKMDRGEMKVKITDERIKELELAEMKLRCLENGGVDNWNWYDDSLTPYFEHVEKLEKEEARNKEIETKFYDIMEILSLGTEEPAGSGCGYGFSEESQEEALKVFKGLLEVIRVEQCPKPTKIPK